MDPRPIDTATLAAIAWKNGGGTTRNLAVEPENSGFDDFLWRVSIADVHESGPFSRFPGIDRTIILLEGEGMVLRSGGSEFALTTPFVPHHFEGETAIDAQLISRATRDFNVMVRRGRAKATVEIGRSESRFENASTGVWYCALGHFQIGIHGGDITLAAGHLLRTSPNDMPIHASPNASDSILIAVLFEPTEAQ